MQKNKNDNKITFDMCIKFEMKDYIDRNEKVWT